VILADRVRGSERLGRRSKEARNLVLFLAAFKEGDDRGQAAVDFVHSANVFPVDRVLVVARSGRIVRPGRR
jgi:hypothetical protein